MANKVRFIDSVAVSAYGNTGTGGTSVSSSYAETASFAHYATSASYAISASHEIIKEISSSHADTASYAQSGDGIFSGSFSGSFEGDGSGLTGLSTDTNIALTYFVSPSGSDSEGIVGDLHKPYKTILAAVNQAVTEGAADSLIYTFPGTYAEDSLQYESGSFFFTPGTIITGRPQYHGTDGLKAVNQGTKTFSTPGNFETHFNVPGKKFRITGSTGNDGIYTVVSAVNNGPNTDIVVVEVIPDSTVNGRLSDAIDVFALGDFDTDYLLYGNTGSLCKVYGEVTINRSETIDADWPGSAISAFSGSDVYFECHSIYQERGIGAYVKNNGKLTLRGEFFEVGTSGYGVTVRDASDTVFNFQRIKSAGSNCFFIREGDTAGFNGSCRVEAEELVAVGGAQNLVFVNVTTGAKIFIECPDITAETWTVNNGSHTGGEIRIVGNITSPLGIISGGTNGYFKLIGDLIANDNSPQFNYIYGGNVFINGDIYHNSTPTAITSMVDLTAGTLRINGKIENTTTGGVGINKTGGTLLIDNSRFITDNYSISASTAQDVFINNTLSSDVSASSDITFTGPGIYTSNQTGQIINTNLSSSATSTASFGTYLGDGSQLTNLPASSTFPFTGDAQITGSLIISGSFIPHGNGPTSSIAIGNLADADAGSYNVAIGSSAETTSTFGIAIGMASAQLSTIAIGHSSIGGDYTIAIGHDAGNVSGDNNILLGHQAGFSTTGDGNIIIGSGSLGAAGLADQLRIGTGNDLVTISASLITGDIIFPSTASAAYFSGDGSQLTNLPGGGSTFPFTGDAQITGSLLISASATSQSLSVIGSGSTVFSVVGSLGELFAIDDVLSGSLLVINDISGIPQFEVFSDGRTLIGASPRSLYTTAVISATSASSTASVYALSTSSYDGVFFDYTITSASNAKAGSIMSVWNGGTITHTETTTTDIGSTSGITFNVIISQSQAQLVAVTDSTDPNTWKVKTIIKAI